MGHICARSPRRSHQTSFCRFRRVGIWGLVGNRRPAISANGRHVAFISMAPLVPEDTNLKADVFIYDLRGGVIRRASVADDESQLSREEGIIKSGFAMSRDGRFVAFMTLDDLEPDVPPTTPGRGETQTGLPISIYVRDMERQSTELGPVTVDGEKQHAFIISTHALSSDGRYLAFATAANDSVPNDTNTSRGTGPAWGEKDVFVFDMKTRRTERVSVTSVGEEVHDSSGYNDSNSAILSSDGRYVLLTSQAGELSDVPDQRCGPSTNINSVCERDLDVFVHDRKTGAVQRASLPAESEDLQCGATPYMDNGEAVGAGCFAALADTWDGRLITFVSQASNLVRGDSNDSLDVFIRDFGDQLGMGTLTRQSLEPRILSSTDGRGDAGGIQSADLIETRVIFRPETDDLFVVEELEDMPRVPGGVGPHSSLGCASTFSRVVTRCELHLSSAVPSDSSTAPTSISAPRSRICGVVTEQRASELCSRCRSLPSALRMVANLPRWRRSARSGPTSPEQRRF